MFEQDFIMRMIMQLVKGMLKCFFKVKDGDEDKAIFQNSEEKDKFEKLVQLVDAGKINEAEDKLFDEINYDSMDDFELSLKFYYYLNEKEDNFLEDHNYKRKSIASNIEYLCKKYDCIGFAEPFLKMM